MSPFITERAQSVKKVRHNTNVIKLRRCDYYMITFAFMLINNFYRELFSFLAVFCNSD